METISVVCRVLPVALVMCLLGARPAAVAPAEFINRLNAEFTEILKSPDTHNRLAARRAGPVTSTPEEADHFIRNEFEGWAKAVHQARAKTN